MIVYLTKWAITIRVRLQLLRTYKLNFLIDLFAPLFIFVFMKLSVWYSVYNGQVHHIINGYSLQDMMQYQVCAFIVALLINGNLTMSLSEDIRLGRLTNYFLYPFSVWEHYTANYIGDRCFRFILLTFTLLLIYILLPSWIAPPFIWQNFLLALFFALGAAMFWYSLGFMIGLLAFWLDEIWTLLVIVQIIAQFLSGAFIPVSFYPHWLQSILYYLPFSLLTYTPVQILMGKTINISQQVYTLIFWLLITQIGVYFVWKKGVKNYTAAGI